MNLHHALAGALCALAFGTVLTAPVHATPAAPPFAQDANAPQYVRVGAGGARLTNLADREAQSVLQAPQGTLLRVHGKSGDFLEVSTPGGLRVWVFGEYVKPASEMGRVEIVANGVRMRPLPEATDSAFPLGQALAKGETLLYIGRADGSKPMTEDWIQVVSPSTARAWIPAERTTPLAAGEDGAQLWEAARLRMEAEIQPREVPGTGASAKDGAKPAPKDGAKEASTDKVEKPAKSAAPAKGNTDSFGAAEKMMEDAKAAAKPNWSAVKTAYQRVIQETPSGPAADAARKRLQEIDARMELAALHEQAQTAEQRRQEALVEKTRELRDASLHNDPLWGRFQARGWVEKDGDRYIVRWANKNRSELACSSKRYDLETLVGYEVGVIGVTRRAAGSDQLGMLDAQRIEVLSGSGPRR